MATSETPHASAQHPVLGTPLDLIPTEDQELIFLAAGCFWGVERILWQTPGVLATATGYMGGHTESPTYVQVCTGTTGHAEAVRVVYDPKVLPTKSLLATFFENHNPTQRNRQGNDQGTQYRGAIWTTNEEQYEDALAVRDTYQQTLSAGHHGQIVTQIHRPPAPVFHYAEDYHQAYLYKNPSGYCNHGFNGVACPRPQTL